MAKAENFTMRVSPIDKAIFEELAQRLGRTQSASLRDIAREVVIALRNEEAQKQELTHPAECVTA